MESTTAKTFYDLLGLNREASAEEIKEAYRELARVFHPDSNYFDEITELPITDENHFLFKAVTEAYNTLTNPEKRRAYDKSLPSEIKSWNHEEEQVVISLEQPKRPRKRTATGKFAYSRFGVLEAQTPTVMRGMKAPDMKAVIKEQKNNKKKLPMLFLALSVGFATFAAVLALLLHH